MNDDQMDELLIQTARDYNTPGVVPRDEMWHAIAAARRGNPSVVTPSASRRHLWLWPSVGVAAAAVLAVGIAIGRSTRSTSPEIHVPQATTVAANPPRDSAAATAHPDTVVTQLHEETRKVDAAVRRLAVATPRTQLAEPSLNRTPANWSGGNYANSENAAAAPSTEQNLAYRLVVLRHLAGSEALITTFRASAKRGEMDAQIAQWSRELLSTTRLLEASAAADDPVMKRLLEDLDLIIAQIAQYAARGTNNPEELELIEQSINQRGVITKLRSTMPATPAAHM
ncbi:MAG TPA: hypothetical protein VN706_21995 [Gemmatimonadaceae bacterium]|nr:hypothetical protein [Gemmatimonadaceae bacterium]